jgi:hypothetical protein
MQIFLSADHHNGTSSVKSWLDFNSITYHERAFWNTEKDLYDLGPDIQNSIVVMPISVFEEPECLYAQYLDHVTEFCARDNQIWFVGTDLVVTLIQSKISGLVKSLDAQIRSNSVVFFLDSQPTDSCYLSHLCNSKVKVLPSIFFGTPRYQSPTAHKTGCRYDYLLTMRRRPDRPHRDVLWHELQRRPALISRGLIAAHAQGHARPKSWLGSISHQHEWQDGHASMDLYLDSWLEIVPETCYKHIYFFTEKTHKPIMTRTPFLVVSTMGYLDWLRNQGFRTFQGLIDERYDLQHRVEDRVHHMVNVLQHIIANGAQDFYQASQDILEHNFRRLSEIHGSWQWQFDQIMWQALEEFDGLDTASRVNIMWDKH